MESGVRLPACSGPKGRPPLPWGPGPEPSAASALPPVHSPSTHDASPEGPPPSGRWVGAKGRSPASGTFFLCPPTPACPQVPGPAVLRSQLPCSRSCFRNPRLSEGGSLGAPRPSWGHRVISDTPGAPGRTTPRTQTGGETPEAYAPGREGAGQGSSGSSHRGSPRTQVLHQPRGA